MKLLNIEGLPVMDGFKGVVLVFPETLKQNACQYPNESV